jgi:hypothetical protein
MAAARRGGFLGPLGGPLIVTLRNRQSGAAGLPDRRKKAANLTD